MMTKERKKLDGVLALISDAPGAMPKGTRVVKLPTDEADERHKPGDMATVIGSMANPGPEFPKIKFMYCLEWDDMPGMPVFCADFKIARVQ